MAVSERSDESAHVLAVATVRNRHVHCSARNENAKKKTETSWDRKPVAQLVRKLRKLQVYNELDCYRDSVTHVKLLSEEKRKKAHISLWRSVEPQHQGRISIMERIFGSKACKMLDYFFASDARRAEIRRFEVKREGTQNFTISTLSR